MTQLKKLCWVQVLLTLTFLFVSVAGAFGQGGQGTTTVTVTDPNAQLFVLLGKGPKGTTPIPVTGTPSQTGQQFNILPQVFTSNSAPVPDGLALYDCGDNITVAAPPDLPPDQVPCPNGNKSKPLGYIPTGGTGTVRGGVLTVTRGAVTGPAPTAPSVSGAPPAKPLFWGQVGIGFGGGFPTGVNTCNSFRQVFPGAPCNSSNHAFALQAEGLFGITRWFAAGGTYNYVESGARNATAPSFTEHSTIQPQYETFTGRVIVPVGRVSLFGEGGIAFWQTQLKEQQDVGSSTPPVVTSLNIEGTSVAAGGGVQVMVTDHIGFGGHFQFHPEHKGPVLNANVYEAVAQFNFRF